MLRNLRHKGTLFIEYALILAFIAAIGAFFTSSNTTANSITSIFGTANKQVELALNGKKSFADYKNNTVGNFIKFVERFVLIDSYKQTSKATAEQKALKQKLSVFMNEIPNGTEVLLSSLTAEQ